MKLTYDPSADAMYVYLGRRRRVAKTEELPSFASDRMVDYAQDGTPIGIEVLGTKSGVDVAGLPLAAEVAALLRQHGFIVVAERGAA
ncbi:MAG: DUF2283 domain-containing protein [Dehalococcoidia bacterium]|nr:DUF2283 domain-containing protein [Dehalococcoidia bacterium]